MSGVVRSSSEQAKASDPSASVWVSANAGSGKTHVLAQRVVRLLLAGVAPGRILCLTFTKAAAANMSKRVFDMLSRWTGIDDDDLRAALLDMTGSSDHDLAVARTLFARAIETPGGLNVQTIHAFCERLLHMFPFEANVAAGFAVAEADEQEAMLTQAREDVLELAGKEPDSVAGDALRCVALLTGQAKFDSLLKAGLAQRGEIEQALAGPQRGGHARRLRVSFGLGDAETAQGIADDIVTGGPSSGDWTKAAEALEKGSKTDVLQARRVRAFLAARDVASLVDIVLGSQGQPRARFATNATISNVPDIVVAELQRVPPLLGRHRAALCVDQSMALFDLLQAIFTRYRQIKAQRSRLDFADLIERTLKLLTRSNAAWVLYKLDGGIDHVLVDEAQDTSPDQWKIIENLTREFFAGAGARAGTRTLFAVGDEKQSIYSFQGARPELFARMRAIVESWAAGAVRSQTLADSYRSASIVLQQVDTALQPHKESLLSAGEGWVNHRAYKHALPGLVEIWDVVGPSEKSEPDSWLLPVDAPRESAPDARLAHRIAAQVAQWIAPGSGVFVHGDDGAPRPVRAGDVLVLVRKRSAFFHAMIRAFKTAGVPVAGADVLRLTEHIAVMDLMAAGRFALLPQDDLALACVLVSPLGGLKDDDLIELAPSRKGTLLEALLASQEPGFRAAAARVSQWPALAARSTPFSFYADLLGAEGGRRRLLERLGAEANDAIDEFLNRALAHGTTTAPSLARFLHDLAAADASIKRDLEAAGDVVRVMTVHAAKGLEGKIVFLPDTTTPPGSRFDPNIVFVGDDPPLPVWRRRKDDDPAVVEAAKLAARAEQQREYLRQLYVAMTRAEERLYICGYSGKDTIDEKSWYAIVRGALEPGMESAPAPWDAQESVLRIGAVATQGAPKQVDLPLDVGAPGWLMRPAPPERPMPLPLSPSRALEAVDQHAGSPGVGAPSGGLLAGSLMHALLQYLPQVAPVSRAPATERFLAARGVALSQSQRDALAAQALRIFDAPATAALFGPASRAEVAVTGRIARPGRTPLVVAGRLDRIAVRDDDVLIADFKTGAPRDADAMPAGYVAQMALYAAAVGPLYPGRRVRPFIVWTADASSVEIMPARIEAALESVDRTIPQS